MTSRIKEYLASDWTAFETLFTEALASDVTLLNQINAYLCQRSGKQLRPMLALLSARMCAPQCNCRTIACAVGAEMIHTATLLHDDVADNSDLRRGDLSVKAAFSPAASVLMGDFWLARAMETVLRDCRLTEVGDFAKCLAELSEGELFQMEKAESLDTTESDYYTIIDHKTAALFRAAMCSGAHSVNASDEDVERVRAYATHLGLAFQIRDDILDYSRDTAVGKPTGQDILEGKITLPLIGAFRNADSEESQRTLDAIKGGRYEGVEDFVARHRGNEYAQNVLEGETAKAIDAISGFRNEGARQLLEDLARLLCFRSK